MKDNDKRRPAGLDRETFYGAACEAINFLEAACSAGAPVLQERLDKDEARRCLDEAEKWLAKARGLLGDAKA